MDAFLHLKHNFSFLEPFIKCIYFCDLQVDLALGHVAALNHVADVNGCVAYNVGTGNGYSVLDMVKV